MRRLFLLTFLLALISPPAQAAQRLAFVVGVDAYAQLGPGAQLQRAASDARAVAAAAQSLGYRVTLLAPDVGQETFLRRFGSFADGVQPGDTVLFYFAGHGIALQGTNYLLPSDIPAIEAGQEMLARSRSLAEADLSAALRARGARVVVMVIDACRNNPFPKNGTRSLGEARGLTRTEPAEGVFSLYAAGAGQQALDRLPGSDPDPNSVFTRVFVRQMRKPGLNLIDLGESVRDEVARIAETVPHKQVPAYYNEVRGARFLALAGPDAPSVPAEGGVPPAAAAASPSISAAVAARPDPAPPSAVLPPPAQPVPASGPASIQYPPPAHTLMRPPPTEKPTVPSSAAAPLAAIDRPPVPSAATAPLPLAATPPPPSARVDLPAPPRLGLFSHPIMLDPNGDNWLALRSAPSGRDGTRLAKLGPETLFSVLGRQGIWLNVRLRDGRSGWVHGDYVGCCRKAPLEP